ncbi:unnamed protein product [Timema podura]|uniref:HTH psq-type domain-containing protein n=1 Tax=Timema podura TaxID=61482 RepID=A0ABN7NEN0_TIMPD|nr:unnamed protein product [Timema podura]
MSLPSTTSMYSRHMHLDLPPLRKGMCLAGHNPDRTAGEEPTGTLSCATEVLVSLSTPPNLSVLFLSQQSLNDGDVYTKEQKEACLHLAVMTEIREKLTTGYSKRQLAKEYGTYESTLRKRMKVGTSISSLGCYKAVFTPAQERELADHVKDFDA